MSDNYHRLHHDSALENVELAILVLVVVFEFTECRCNLTVTESRKLTRKSVELMESQANLSLDLGDRGVDSDVRHNFLGLRGVGWSGCLVVLAKCGPSRSWRLVDAQSPYFFLQADCLASETAFVAKFGDTTVLRDSGFGTPIILGGGLWPSHNFQVIVDVAHAFQGLGYAHATDRSFVDTHIDGTHINLLLGFGSFFFVMSTLQV